MARPRPYLHVSQLEAPTIARKKSSKVLTSHTGEVDPESASFKTLGRELMKAFQGVLNVRIKRSAGDYSVPDEDDVVNKKWTF